MLLTMSENTNSHNYFLAMPVELITRIYCQLPLFTDAFALTETCHRMRSVWTDNTAQIYAQIGPRSIPCERYALAFRQDQAGLPVDRLKISTQDIVCIVHNAKIVEEAIRQFERNVVSKVCCRAGFRSRTYSPENIHPPNFTRTERVRFIRMYYQLWGIMKVEITQLESRLESTPLKQLFYLCEMAQFNYHDEPECRKEGPFIRYPWFPDAEPGSIHATYIWEWTARGDLGFTILRHLDRRYLQIHGRDAPVPMAYGKQGYYPFVALWDYWQSSLQEIVCGTEPGLQNRDPSVERTELGAVLKMPHLWYEEEHEECIGNPELFPYLRLR